MPSGMVVTVVAMRPSVPMDVAARCVVVAVILSHMAVVSSVAERLVRSDTVMMPVNMVMMVIRMRGCMCGHNRDAVCVSSIAAMSVGAG